MARLIRLSITIVGVFGVLSAASPGGHTSKDFAALARVSWNAFECSSLASMTGNVKEQERLFLFGYQQGKIFTAAFKAKKIRDEDLRREVPLVEQLELAIGQLTEEGRVLAQDAHESQFLSKMTKC